MKRQTPPTYQIFTKLLPEMKSGQSVLVESPGKTCTAYAAQTGQKITTAKVLVIDDVSGTPITTTMIRVTKV